RIIPRLPSAAWIVLGGDALSAVGSGLTLPFLLVYLHQVRGLGYGVAGLAVATVAFASLLGNPVGGVEGDRQLGVVGTELALLDAQGPLVQVAGHRRLPHIAPRPPPGCR